MGDTGRTAGRGAIASIAVGVALTACGALGQQYPPEPRPTTAIDCADLEPPGGAPGDAPIMLTLGGKIGGWGSSGSSGITVIYADGAVADFEDAPFEATASRPGGLHGRFVAPYYGPSPGVFRAGHLSSCALEELVAQADVVFAQPDRDFGQPGITDQPSSTVSYRAPGTERITTYSIYAFGHERNDDRVDTNVSRTQLEARDQVTEMINFVTANIVPGDLIGVERLEVYNIGGVADGEVAWPGPVPSDIMTTHDCGELSGEDAATVFEFLAAGNEPGDDLDYRFFVRTLPPLLPAC